jgi:hypothetical protein
MQTSTNLVPSDGEPEITVERSASTEERLGPGVRTAVLLVIAMLLSAWGVAVTQGSVRLLRWLAQFLQ